MNDDNIYAGAERNFASGVEELNGVLKDIRLGVAEPFTPPGLLFNYWERLTYAKAKAEEGLAKLCELGYDFGERNEVFPPHPQRDTLDRWLHELPTTDR